MEYEGWPSNDGRAYGVQSQQQNNYQDQQLQHQSQPHNLNTSSRIAVSSGQSQHLLQPGDPHYSSTYSYPNSNPHLNQNSNNYQQQLEQQHQGFSTYNHSLPPTTTSAPQTNSRLSSANIDRSGRARSRLESGGYDSFFNDYITLYGKEKLALQTTVEDDGDNSNQNNMSYSRNRNQPQYQYQNQNQPQNQTQHYNQYHNPPPIHEDDHRRSDYNQHQPPYRDSPSPDMHPGMAIPRKMVNPSYNTNMPNNEDWGGSSNSNNANATQHHDRSFYAAGETAIAATAATSAYNNPHINRSITPPGTTAYDPDNPNVSNPFLTPDNRTSYGSADNITTFATPPTMASAASSFRNLPRQNYSQNTNLAGPSVIPPYRNPYDAHSISRDNLDGLDYVDVNAIADDGDHGLYYNQPKRNSILNINRRSVGSNAALAGAGAGAGVVGATALGEQSRAMFSPDPSAGEKPALLGDSAPPFIDRNMDQPRKWKRWLFIVLGFLIIGAIVAGVVVGLEKSKSSSNNNNGSSNGSGNNSPANLDGPDYDLNSAPVKALLNNKNLHKVFTGMAYTPMNTQYPGCLSLAPLQNNVTLDFAVISQLTNTIRLYGTDCNQTELTLTAIDKLQLTDMKIWVGVWLENNQTTNARQIQQLYDILDGPYVKYIKGVIVGNEVLFRQDLSLTQLTQYITDVKSNLTARNIELPVASADLGDNWTADYAAVVDVVMSNVHPFFGGVTVDAAAAWTWSFWQTHDVILTAGTNKTNVISEVGWPSQGGNDCAPALTCPDATSGSVSGLSEMQTFLDTWVCQSLANETEYFWFEAYDEPWKIQYDVPGQAWEDHWGLFDVDRNLKPDITVPNCNGQTV